MRTNKEILGKGIKYIVIAMSLMVLGPFVLHFGFQVRNYLSLSIGGIISITGILLFFKGINTLLKALFND